MVTYKNSSKPMLICTSDKKFQKALINDLKDIYENINANEVLTFVIVKNKGEYFCKVRYKECKISKVISSECKHCKEKLSCIYQIEKQQIREQKYKYEIIDSRQFVNKLLGNLKFYESYSKVVLYKGSADSLVIKISEVELDALVNSLRPKKLNTNEKEKLNRLCNKFEKIIAIFFSNLENRDKTIQNKYALIKELEKLQLYEDFKVRYILNKLKCFNIDAVVNIKEHNQNKIITFKVNLNK